MVLKKAERRIYDRRILSERPSNSFKLLLLVTLPCMNDMMSISIHKELQSYHQVSCCPESVTGYKMREPNDLRRELYAVRL